MTETDECVEPRASTVAHFRAFEAPLLWCEDPIAPVARTEVLLGAYHVLTTYLVPGCALVHTGQPTEDDYVQRITAFKNELNLVRLWLEPDPEPEVRAAFAQCAVLGVTLLKSGEGANGPVESVPVLSVIGRTPSSVAEEWACALMARSSLVESGSEGDR